MVYTKVVEMVLLSDYVIPILSLILGLFTFAVFCYAFIKINNFFNMVVEIIKQIFQPDTETGLSSVGKILHIHATDIGQEVSQGFQRGITGSMGGTIKRANQEISAELARDNPQLAQQMAFNSMLPKGMKNNPWVSMFMQSIFNKAINSFGGNSGKDRSDGNHAVINPDSGYMG